MRAAQRAFQTGSALRQMLTASTELLNIFDCSGNSWCNP